MEKAEAQKALATALSRIIPRIEVNSADLDRGMGIATLTWHGDSRLLPIYNGSVAHQSITLR